MDKYEKKINIYSIIGFIFAISYAININLSLPEFSWSTWLAGLAYTWVGLFSLLIKIIIFARTDKPIYEKFIPIINKISSNNLLLIVILLSTFLSYFLFNISIIVFSFYGLFLSVFAEMEPNLLFGRNGFINSDFFTPLFYLFDHFWPIILAVLISNWKDFLIKKPLNIEFQSLVSEITRMHIFTILLPFLSIIAFVIFKDSYQLVTISILMAIFYLFPKNFSKL